MTKGITGKEPDPRTVYADIIDLPHHTSDRHPPMSLHDRAAQFSPYAALTGYDDMVKEEARQTDRRIEPGEEDLERLNRQLERISREIRQGNIPAVTVTRFIPDPLKEGGRYETATERIRKVDPAGGKVVLDRKTGKSGSRAEIRIGDILDIQFAGDRDPETGGADLSREGGNRLAGEGRKREPGGA